MTRQVYQFRTIEIRAVLLKILPDTFLKMITADTRKNSYKRKINAWRLALGSYV